MSTCFGCGNTNSIQLLEPNRNNRKPTSKIKTELNRKKSEPCQPYCFRMETFPFQGEKWDIKLGKDVDSLFKFATVVEVTRSADFVLYVNVKFSEAKFIFFYDYRKVCKDVNT